MPSRQTPPRDVLATQELLTAPEVATLLGHPKLSSFYELFRTGATPDPVLLGGARFWRRRELAAWVDAGCPCRDGWVWQPSLPVKLETYLAQLKRQLAETSQQIKALEADAAAGHTIVGMYRQDN